METSKPSFVLAGEVGRRQRAEGRWVNRSEISVLPTVLCPSADRRRRGSGVMRAGCCASRCAVLRGRG